MSDWFEVHSVAEDVQAISEPHHAEQVISYLIAGTDRAILLDTGMGIGNIHELVASLDDKPVLVVNSHHHYDHVGDNWRFQHIAIHTSEAPYLEREAPEELLIEAMRPENIWGALPPGFDSAHYRILPSKADQMLTEGDVIELGGRDLRVLHTPGHSPGSICLLSDEEGLLFTGDTVYAGPLYTQFAHSDFEEYRVTMARLSALASDLRLVLPSHNDTPLDPHILAEIAEGFEEIAAGTASWQPVSTVWGALRRYEFDRFGVLLPRGPSS
jgi:glyoxylase-like metal-dependent hydrolase (beta-lactamase superfamily II)